MSPSEETVSPMIVVDQPDALIDQPIALRGFAPRQPVTATQTYAQAASRRSHATFISDNDDQVGVPVTRPYQALTRAWLRWTCSGRWIDCRSRRGRCYQAPRQQARELRTKNLLAERLRSGPAFTPRRPLTARLLRGSIPPVFR
jgi:hypothetical protein